MAVTGTWNESAAENELLTTQQIESDRNTLKAVSESLKVLSESVRELKATCVLVQRRMT